MEEEFRIIKDYDNYSVSNLGNIKNNKTGKIMKLSMDGKGYYKINLFNDKKPQTKYVHRLVGETFIPNPLNKKCIDHKDNNPLNNHISNLRYATHQENQFNQQLSSSNTSGSKGVHFNKREKKWVAKIKVNGKSKHLGLFDKKEDAIRARVLKAKELYGEFMNECEKIKDEIAELKDDKQRELDEIEELDRELDEILNC